MRITPVLLLATLVACTASPGGPGGDAAVVSLHAGSAQTTFTGTAVPTRPAVLVTSRGEPVVGITVTFRVVDGGGTVQGAIQVTGADGVARVDAWILGSAGPQTLEAVVGDALGSPVLFAATAVHTVPAIVRRVRGDGIEGTVGLPLNEAPLLRVTDAQGRPSAGIPVSWIIEAGGGGFRYADNVTDENGEAGVTKWILGDVAGINIVTATVDCGSSCAPVRFSANGRAGPVHSMQIVVGDLQQAAAGTAVPVSPTVRVRDVHQNPAESPVMFSVIQGNGSVTNELSIPDATGSASVGSWILGPGENVLRAESAGVSVLFRATGTE
jgi:adhesin/invasin